MLLVWLRGLFLDKPLNKFSGKAEGGQYTEHFFIREINPPGQNFGNRTIVLLLPGHHLLCDDSIDTGLNPGVIKSSAGSDGQKRKTQNGQMDGTAIAFCN